MAGVRMAAIVQVTVAADIHVPPGNVFEVPSLEDARRLEAIGEARILAEDGAAEVAASGTASDAASGAE